MIVGMCSCSAEGLIEPPRTGVTSDCKPQSVDAGNQTGSCTRVVYILNHWGIFAVPLCLCHSGSWCESGSVGLKIRWTRVSCNSQLYSERLPLYTLGVNKSHPSVQSQGKPLVAKTGFTLGAYKEFF